jgi:hypothetical protein
MTTYVAQSNLTARLGSAGLVRLASDSGSLDATATARITAVLADVNAEIGAVLAGLSIYEDNLPDVLVGVGYALCCEALWRATWGTRTNAEAGKAYLEAARAARSLLRQFADGQAGLSTAATAQQVASEFSWSNVGDEPSTDNPRATVRSRMRRLP